MCMFHTNLASVMRMFIVDSLDIILLVIKMDVLC